MKKLYMRTIIGPSVLIILFRFYGSKAGLFESNLFWMANVTPPRPSNFILEEEEELIQ